MWPHATIFLGDLLGTRVFPAVGSLGRSRGPRSGVGAGPLRGRLVDRGASSRVSAPPAAGRPPPGFVLRAHPALGPAPGPPGSPLLWARRPWRRSVLWPGGGRPGRAADRGASSRVSACLWHPGPRVTRGSMPACAGFVNGLPGDPARVPRRWPGLRDCWTRRDGTVDRGASSRVSGPPLRPGHRIGLVGPSAAPSPRVRLLEAPRPG